MNFTLHPQLAQDCTVAGDLKICRVLLMNNRHFPWLILVPMREGLRELHDLSEKDYHSVMAEVRHVSSQFCALTKADKMNVATLGNMVPQLHIHIIARHKQDPAWPKPVWNHAVPEPYPPQQLAEMLEKARKYLGLA